MDYDKFKKEYESFDEYMKQSRKDFILDHGEGLTKPAKPKLVKLEGPHDKNDAWLDIDKYSFGKPPLPSEAINAFRGSAAPDDRVNHPSHYTNGSQEAIVTIEEAIDGAPSIQTGMLQGQVLKYLLRVWYKDNPLEDLKKAQWYLNRLIEKLQ